MSPDRIDNPLALDVEAAQQFLLSIPLLVLETDPIRKRSNNTVYPERQTSRGSGEQTLSGSAQSSAVECRCDGQGALSLDINRAEQFLLSLDVSENEAQRFCSEDEAERSEDARSRPQVQPVARPARAKQGARAKKGAARTRSRGESRRKPGIIKKGLAGGRAIMAGRRQGSNVISTLPHIDNAGVLQLQSRSEVTPVHSQGRSSCCSYFCPQRRGEVEVIGTSYKQYLVPGDSGSYDPDFLDDRSLQYTVVDVEPHEVFVNPFNRKSKYKEEMNEQFRQRHPWLDRSMTLSKLRNLQKDLREMTLAIPRLDMSTVAIAWVYFEKLVLGNHVRKSNRKLLAAACLVLAFKFNQHGDRTSLQQLACCIRKLDRKDQLNLDDLQDAELKVFVWLKFSLRSRDADVMLHLHRMLNDLRRSMTEYYGAEALRGTVSDPPIDEEIVAEQSHVLDESFLDPSPYRTKSKSVCGGRRCHLVYI